MASSSKLSTSLIGELCFQVLFSEVPNISKLCFRIWKMRLRKCKRADNSSSPLVTLLLFFPFCFLSKRWGSGMILWITKTDGYLVILRFPNNVKVSRIHFCGKALRCIQMDRQAPKLSIHSEPCRNAYLKKWSKSDVKSTWFINDQHTLLAWPSNTYHLKKFFLLLLKRDLKRKQQITLSSNELL